MFWIHISNLDQPTFELIYYRTDNIEVTGYFSLLGSGWDHYSDVWRAENTGVKQAYAYVWRKYLF